MPADKKTEQKLPRPEKDDKNIHSKEKYDAKGKTEQQKSKHKRVNYIIKDLPIY